MNLVPPPGRQRDPRERTRRDIERLERRGSDGHFWQSLGLIGSVGWPIVVFAIGGALLGRALDHRLGAGVRFTLVLLTVGTVVGSYAAYRAVRGNDS